MFNWFRRSSKSGPAAPAATRTGLRPTSRQSRHDRAPADALPAGIPAAGGPQALAQLPAYAQQMSLGAQRILAQLPPGVALAASCARYPQAVERLLNHWRDPLEFRIALDGMLTDSRGGRQGFPFEVLSELGALGQHYDLYVSPVGTSAWSSVTSR